MTRNERVDLRLPAQVKQEIERAAALCGQTVSNFILGATLPQARAVIHEAEVTELTNRDRDIFLAMLDAADAEPTEAMRRAAERYKTSVG